MINHYVPQYQFILLPNTKQEWVEYRKEQCADDTQWEKCMAAQIQYFQWLQINHPREFLMEAAKDGSRVLEFKRKRF